MAPLGKNDHEYDQKLCKSFLEHFKLCFYIQNYCKTFQIKNTIIKHFNFYVTKDFWECFYALLIVTSSTSMSLIAEGFE